MPTLKLEVWVDHDRDSDHFGAHCAREVEYPVDFFDIDHWSGVGRNASHLTPTQALGDDIENLVTEFGETYPTVEIKLFFKSIPEEQRTILPNGEMR